MAHVKLTGAVSVKGLALVKFRMISAEKPITRFHTRGSHLQHHVGTKASRSASRVDLKQTRQCCLHRCVDSHSGAAVVPTTSEHLRYKAGITSLQLQLPNTEQSKDIHSRFFVGETFSDKENRLMNMNSFSILFTSWAHFKRDTDDREWGNIHMRE